MMQYESNNENLTHETIREGQRRSETRRRWPVVGAEQGERDLVIGQGCFSSASSNTDSAVHTLTLANPFRKTA